MARSPVNGLSINEAWAALFAENETAYKAKDRRPRTDAQLTVQMEKWFPNSVGKAGTIRAHMYRCCYNKGSSMYAEAGPAGVKGRPTAFRYDGKGARIEGRVASGSAYSTSAKKSTTKKTAKKSATKKTTKKTAKKSTTKKKATKKKAAKPAAGPRVIVEVVAPKGLKRVANGRTTKVVESYTAQTDAVAAGKSFDGACVVVRRNKSKFELTALVEDKTSHDRVAAAATTREKDKSKKST